MLQARHYRNHYSHDDAEHERLARQANRGLPAALTRGWQQREERKMTTKYLIAAAALAVAVGITPATAASVSADADSAMHENQKLGPNAYSTQFDNSIVTQRRGVPNRAIVQSRGPLTGPAYVYEPPAYAYQPAPLHDW
jgi:anti-sigma factor RsiW